MAAWIQEDTERDYSQREYRKNVLVVGDRVDSENKFSTTTKKHGATAEDPLDVQPSRQTIGI
jgi:hypothetical protein